jgi:hypothetical protein
MNDLTKKERRIYRCIRIGNQFIEGPRALFPPKRIDDYGWLEPQLRITLYHGFKRLESIAVYVDNSMNRDKGFLPPMLRYCSWNRREDQKAANTWPSLELRLGRVRSRKAVSALITAIQHQAQTLRFEAAGLQATRNEVKVVDENNFPGYSLFLANWCQQLDYTSRSIAGDKLKPHVFQTFGALASALVEIDKTGWRERFDRNLKPESARKDWEWVY